jgi:hypothetical protein
VLDHWVVGMLASRRLMDSVVFDLCRGPGTVAQVVCSRSRARIQRSSTRPKKKAPCNDLAVGRLAPKPVLK